MVRVGWSLLIVSLLGASCSIDTKGNLYEVTREGGTGRLDACATCDFDAGPPPPDTGELPDVVVPPADVPVAPEVDAGCVARGGECEPGELRPMETEPCGLCGTRSRTQVCNPSCVWEGDWPACGGEGECVPGAAVVTYPDCDGCTQVRMRTCGGDCRYGAERVYGECGSSSCLGERGYEYCEGVYPYMGGLIECCGSDEWDYPGGC